MRSKPVSINREVASTWPASTASCNTKRQLAAAQPILLPAFMFKTASPFAETLHIRTTEFFSAQEIESAVGTQQGIRLLRQFGDARHGDQPQPLDAGLHQLHPDLLLLQGGE